MSSKSQLRSAAKAARQAHVAALSVAERGAASVSLAGYVEPHLEGAVIVAAYLPIGTEVDTLALIERVERRGVTIALPHVTGRSSALRFLKWTPSDPVAEGPMGLRQPPADACEVAPDLILTPLLAFDRRLHRLGYGAGHYDRAFAQYPTARRIGLAWSVQQVDTLPDDSWDVPLHAVVTEKGVLTR